jgi:septum formation protein
VDHVTSHGGRGPQQRLPHEIILASASPRRHELLLQIGIESTVMPADIDESSIRHDEPTRLAVQLARAKALAVAPRGTPTLPILAADTVVAVAGEILEKPQDVADARRMLSLLSGKTHQVITGVAVLPAIDPAPGVADADRPSPIVRSCESHVSFAELSGEEIDGYIESLEWRGVAGGYRIQGLAARFITHLSGSYSNVVGLPLHLVYSILTGHNL